MNTMRKRSYHFLAILLIMRDGCTFQLKFNQCLGSRLNKGSKFTLLKLQQNQVINAQDVSIPIIYEDENLLAICKPPGIPHHDDPQSSQMGILSLLRQQQSEQTFPYSGRLYGIHRLDRVTSGILLFAKDSTTANEMITKFRNREVKKYYFAISGKKPKKKKQGWVKGMMVKGRRGSYKLLNEKEKRAPLNNGKVDGQHDDKTNNQQGDYAKTRFYTAGLGNLDLAFTPSNNEEQSDKFATPKTAILFEPHTGKTHQLRVASKAVGLPILGDERYGGGHLMAGPSEEEAESDSWPLDRTYLHASAIHFQMNDYNVTICSSPPFDHLFDSSDGKKALNSVFVAMMGKYCDCLPLLEAVHEASELETSR